VVWCTVNAQGQWDAYEIDPADEEAKQEIRARIEADRARFEADKRAEALRRSSELHAVHASLLASTAGVIHSIVEMHSPAFFNDRDDMPRCTGCAAIDDEWGPAWPCPTYALVMKGDAR